MNSIQKKSGKKKMMILSIVGVLFLSLIAAFIFAPKGKGAFEEEKAEKADITTYYSFTGAVEATRKQNVISQKEMHIEEVLVNEGDLVKTGDVLLRNAEGEEIKAEIDGEVAKVFTKNNSHALKGSQLMDIVDYSHLLIKVKVDEYDLKYVAVGQMVDVRMNALEKNMKGTVQSISKEAINENGISYFTAMIDFKEDPAVRLGMSAEVKILKQKAVDVTTISMKAIQFDSKNKPYILKVSEKGEPEKQYVEIGIHDGTIIEIKSGIRIGEVVMVPNTTSENSGAAASMHGGGNS
ncbi:efflux RND transporter periplasmic adaptor subunit [Niallia endozanthoxylica]|uniref:Efflux RND transporter periplasmic adaptor subunit n=1 Tax=Niallia endozanthoxylica TaxID=2036016 RepID=A0A5J5HLK7_9BACI|nr:efflux RND transporter periplasmic adaptor subunit [Niallia endozanthoxylica]KAA9021605.1 efflux RND transporter periplasmic adaptor subunit [Niallia endozanthoxylica]